MPRRTTTLLALAVTVTALAVATVAPAPARADGPDPAYWRLAEVEHQLAQWAAAHPDLVHVDTLGATGQGATIPLVRISDNVARREREPAIFLHGAQHANEGNGTGAVMAMMARLLDGHGVDPAITARVDGLELWFAPIVNVDGHLHVFSSGTPHWADWRKTLRDNNGNQQVDFPGDGVDPNRNWDWRWEQSDETDPASQKYKGPFPFSEPEVRALRDFVLRERPAVVVDYHSPVTISWHDEIFYVWPGSPDFDLARDVAMDWAAHTRDRHGDTYDAIYAFDTLPKEQCWVYGNTLIPTFLVEIEDQCWFTGATVDTIAHRVARGAMWLLDRAVAGPGLAVRATDAFSGQPLPAEVVISGLDDPALGPRVCEAATGDLHHLVQPGSYTVTASFRDHETVSQQVSVGSSGWTEVDLVLPPLVTAADDPADADQLVLWAPTPARGGQQVRLRLPATAAAAVAELHDLRGRRVATLGAGLAPATTHLLVLPRELADGVYLLRVRAGAREAMLRVVYVD